MADPAGPERPALDREASTPFVVAGVSDVELVTVVLPHGAAVSLREPSPSERECYELAPGVLVLEVTGPDGGTALYPTDAYRLMAPWPRSRGWGR